MCGPERPLALVTGATKGVGLAVAARLLSRGCRVLGSYGSDEAAARKAGRDLGIEAFHLVRADMAENAGVDILSDAVRRHGGKLRYLVSNVGVTDRTPFGGVTRENWDRVLAINLTSPFFLVQELAPLLEDTAGRIVFIGAVMGIRPHAMSFSYSASKAGLHFLAQCLVKVMAPRGITVNVVAPGFVDTPMQADKAPDHRARVEGKIAMRRFASPREVADAVMSLVELPYVTGQVLSVDGGYDCE